MTIRSLQLPLTFDAGRLYADASRFTGAEWVPHFNIHNYEGDWSVVPLRAVEGSGVQIFPDPTATDGYVETEMMSRCEYVPAALTAFECEFQTVRFLKLAAGSAIRRHRDYNLCYEDGLVRIHIPAVTNPDVEFVLDDQPLRMKEGEAWYLNVNFHHSVRNDGATDRIHLVVDCVVNDWIRAFFDQPVM